MKRHILPGTDLLLSTFSCGLGDLFTIPQAESDAILDAYVEAGGNFFDSAHAYSFWVSGGNGLSEISIGDYVRRRGLKGMVIATKGGHPAGWRYRTVDKYMSPGRVEADIDDSLARLECETIDLYYLHRDDPRMPVGEIMEMMHDQVRRGRIRHLAVSNWTVERMTEANAYAETKGLTRIVLSEPRWSLAVRKTQGEKVVAETTSWHRETQLAVAPYSPTAQGFFATPPAAEGDYVTPENLARWNRVQELAKKRGITPNQVALAWLINHPFPVFPILGTKKVDRLLEAVAADEITLSEEELSWLDRG